MKVKIFIISVLIIFISSCVTNNYDFNPDFASPAVVQKVKDHRVAIAVYYSMSPQEYLRRQKQTITLWSNFNFKSSEAKNENLEIDIKYLEIPVLIKTDQATNQKLVAYLGAGAIVKNNHVLTVNHLFDHDHQNNAKLLAIWILKEGVDHPIKAELIARTKCEYSGEMANDYALLKMEEDLGLPGLEIAKPGNLKHGQRVIFSGSTGGLAFFTRFGYVTQLQHFFSKDLEGRLHLSFWEDFPFWVVYPGGAGDSGGPVTNIQGEIVTMMYCGIAVHEENYVLSNPTAMLWEFLEKYNLKRLLK